MSTPALKRGESTDDYCCNLTDELDISFSTQYPMIPGIYRHRWTYHGKIKEHVLFVGYTNAMAFKLQGTCPNQYMPRKLKCCKLDENLHADRLSPEEWGGEWALVLKATRGTK
ncbi:MAG: hypothetical protein WA159_02960 [Variovorax sp.]